MKTKIERIWDEIAAERQTRLTDESAYVLRRIDPTSTSNIFAGVDGSGRVMLAVGVARTPPPLSLESDSIDYFRQRRTDGTWLMALRLCQMDLVVVFGRLCQDLADSLVTVTDEAQLIGLVEARLELWRRLFEQGVAGLLESTSVKGLIAELLVLESLFVAGIRGPLELVTAWMGPSRADQDFQFRDSAIEVKAIGLGAKSVSISSLQQLDAVVPIELKVLTLRPSSAGECGAVGLNSLVRNLEGSLAPFPDALDLFRAHLRRAAYTEDPYYDSLAFQLVSTETFAVTPSFPKLTQRLVPAGVLTAVYALSLTSLRAGDEHDHG